MWKVLNRRFNLSAFMVDKFFPKVQIWGRRSATFLGTELLASAPGNPLPVTIIARRKSEFWIPLGLCLGVSVQIGGTTVPRLTVT